ncbi:MAG TPA: hypothetical protein VGY55_07520 [Pirellulales bacterium]|jgi:hypothetical protein|nr:hypothetical protein [Pirellulales bacterium]
MLLDPKKRTTSRPPLNLPNGSVRALLTLMIIAVVIAQVARGGQRISTLWTETLMIALAHYFSTRRFIKLAPEVIHQLEAEGCVETELHPLYLPQHSIRAIIFAAFVGLAIYLFAQHRLFESEAISILGVVFTYFFGTIVGMALRWWTKGRQTQAIRGWQDVKAIAVIAVLAYTASLYLFDPSTPPPTGLRNTTLGMVLFYFGSR